MAKRSSKKAEAESKKPELNDFLTEIEKRAYEIYLERKENNLPGDDLSDWLKAEAEIKSKYNM